MANSAVQTIFQSYDWNRLVWEEHDTDQLVLLLIRQQNTEKPVGIAPLFLSEQNGVTKIRLIGELRGDYADLLLNHVFAKPVLKSLIKYLFEQFPSVSILQLDKLPPGSDLLASAKKVYRRTLLADGAVCPSWVFSQDSAEKINKKLNNKKMRYYQRRLAKQGNYRIEHLTDAEAIKPYLDAFYDQHIERWSLTPWPSRFLKQRERDFYYLQLEVFAAKKELLFSLLYLDDGPVGFHFGFCAPERFIWYKPTYNVKYKKYSPGLILMKECIQYAIDFGCAEFDFAAGNESYKGRFANRVRRNKNLVMYSNWSSFIYSKGKRYIYYLKQGIKNMTTLFVKQ